MKTTFSSSQRGSAFITVMMFCTILLLLIASVLKYSTYERRLNNRGKLLMEARAAGEALSEYGIAQVKKVLESNRQFTDSVWSSSDEALFVTGGSYAGSVAMPADGFWGGGHIVDSTGSAAEKPLMTVGKILDTSAGGLYFVDPTNPDNDNDPLKGKRVFRYDLDILSRATAIDTFGGGNVTKYMQQSFSIRAVPLFANAVYYNMDLEVWPGPTMTITGSTHTNQRLFARPSSNTALTFAGPVTAVKGFWTVAAGSPTMPFFQYISDTGGTTTAATGSVSILKAGLSTTQSMQLSAATTGYSPNLANSTWVESTWNLAPSGETWQKHIGDGTTAPTETVASKANYANWTRQNIKGNLLTHVNGLTAINLQGIPDYSYTYGSVYPDPNAGTADLAYTYISGGNDTTNAAHGLIESPRLTTAASYLKAVEDIKYSRLAGLYIVANTTQATAVGHQPDGTTINVGARSYRAFMNNTSVTPAVITEVLLPGQKTWGDSNLLQRTAALTPLHGTHFNSRPIVQMLNIDYSASTAGVEHITWNSGSSKWVSALADQRRMTDMRRTGVLDADLATATTTFNHAATRSSSNKFIAKKLFMIDIDVTELKKAVETMATVAAGTTATSATGYYHTGLPGSASVTFANYIYKSAATTTTVSLSDMSRIIVAPATQAAALTQNLTNAFTTSIWNGAVYVESIAAQSFNTAGSTAAIRKAITHNNHNSGVRLINGRGKVPSTTSAPGFTLATNDVVYILGSFNCDGLSTTPATVAKTVPDVPGDSTGHYPDDGLLVNSTELPASVAADAVVLMSQPVSANATSQDNGWNDVFSDNYCTYSSTYSTNWATTAPSSSNGRDGENVDSYPYKVPYDSSNGSWTSGTHSADKLTPGFSEYSVAMLCGIVPTGKNGVTQNSGGLHNFPRFLEDWTGVDCRIRGAMVALFECRVATEPWNLRCYAPPNRIWGFNLLFNTGTMPPLTPKTIHFRRSMANDITKAAYNAKLTGWGYTALP